MVLEALQRVSVGLRPQCARSSAGGNRPVAQVDALAHVAPGGTLIVNVLIERTTYLDMFEPGRYTLFGEDEVAARCAGWRILESRHDTFDAPGATVKRFATVIAGR
jgi:tellurite methyltransferase